MLAKIMDLIEKEKVVSPQSVAVRLRISVSQARNALTILEQQGLLSQIKGLEKASAQTKEECAVETGIEEPLFCKVCTARSCAMKQASKK